MEDLRQQIHELVEHKLNENEIMLLNAMIRNLVAEAELATIINLTSKI